MEINSLQCKMPEGKYLIGDPDCFISEWRDSGPGEDIAIIGPSHIRIRPNKQYGPHFDSEGYAYLGDSTFIDFLLLDEGAFSRVIDQRLLDFSLKETECKIVHSKRPFLLEVCTKRIVMGEYAVYLDEEYYEWDENEGYAIESLKKGLIKTKPLQGALVAEQLNR